MKLLIHISFLLFILFANESLFSQSVDQSFKPLIKNVPDVTAICMLSDGGFFIGGNITSLGKLPVKSIIKLNHEGSIDNSFNCPIQISYPGRISAIQIDADGKILVGAFQYKINGFSHIARLNTNGSIDMSFNCPLFNVNNIKTIEDGKYFVSANDNIYRINNDGSLDLTFNAFKETFGLYTGAFKVLKSGKILGAIHFTSVKFGTSVGRLVRLNADGSLDETFAVGTCEEMANVETYIQDIEELPDNKILVAGKFNSYNKFKAIGILRLNNNGSIDSSFYAETEGMLNYNGISDIELAEDDKILVACGGMFGDNHNKILKLNNDGKLDSFFKIGVIELYTEMHLPNFKMYYPQIRQYNGRLFTIGSHIKYNNIKSVGVTILKIDGLIDDSFNLDLGGNPVMNTVCRDKDGKTVIGGEFNNVNGIPVKNFVRFNKDNSVDSIFIKNIGSGTDNQISYIATQLDSSILVGGFFNFINGKNTGLLFRLRSDGTLDETFKAVVNGKYVKKILVDSVGNIIICGEFSYVNGQVRHNIAFLNPDGSLNMKYADVVVYADKMYRICNADFQSDGKLIIGGTVFNTLNLYSYITRLDQNGNIDASFENNISKKYLETFKVVENDHVVVGELACGYQSTGIIHLDKNGELIDEASIMLSQSSERCTEISSILYPGDDQVIIGGSFSSINGTVKSNLVKVSLNGDVDEYFKYDIEGLVSQFFEEDSNHVFVVGTFNRIGNDSDLFSVARISIDFPNKPSNLSTDNNLKSAKSSGLNLKWKDLSDNETGFSVERSLDEISYTKLGETVNDYFNDSTAEVGTNYYYRVKAFNKNGSSGFANSNKLVYIKNGNISKNIYLDNNPGNGNFRINLTNIKSNDIIVKVFNITGNLVYSKKNQIKADSQMSVDLTSESAGIYFVEIVENGNKQVFKYIKY